MLLKGWKRNFESVFLESMFTGCLKEAKTEQTCQQNNGDSNNKELLAMFSGGI